MPLAPSLVQRMQNRYAFWVAVAPTLVFAAGFALACLYECAAAPWLVFIAAPVVSVAIGIAAAIHFWQRASGLPEKERAGMRRYIGTSILWGPVLAFVVFFAAFALVAFLLQLAFG